MSTSYIERIEISNPQRLKSYTAMFLLPLGYMPSLVWCIQNLFHTNTVVGIYYRYTGQIGTFIRYMFFMVSKQFSPISFHHTLTQSRRELQPSLMKQMRFIFFLEQRSYTSFFNILTSLFT